MEEVTKERPSDIQLEIIMSDWLTGKRDESFIHKNTDKALTRKLGKDEHISDYLIGNADPLDVLKNARSMAQSIVSSMVPERVKVKVGGNGSVTSFAEDGGKTINIATDYFDRNDLSDSDKVDIMTGFSVHEAAHVKYTEAGKEKKHGDGLDDIRHAVCNIIEDERIEHLVGEDTPGFADFLGRAKKHVWGNTEKQLEHETVNEPVAKFLKNLLYAVRYPSALKKEDVIEQYDELSEVRKTLTPFPKTQDEVISASERIIDIMKDLADKQDKEQQKQQQKDRKENSKDEQKKDGNGSSDSSPKDGKNRQQEQQRSSPSEALKKALESGQAQAMQNILKENATAARADLNKKNSRQIADHNRKDVTNGDAEGETGGNGKIMYIRSRKGDRTNYAVSRNRIAPHINAVKHALTIHSLEKDYTLQGCTSGRINPYKLISYKLGSDRVFTRQGEVRADSACVCILIDESGSMNSGNKMQSARDTAVLINEAVEKIPDIELFVYGFTSNELNVYKERRCTDKWGIGATKASGGTPTGNAMECAFKRIRKVTQENCIMLVLTDGMPDDSLLVRQQDELLRKKGVYPIGVGISNCQAVSDLFKESVVFNDMKDFAPSIGHIVKDKLMKLMARHDSLC